MHVHWRGYLVLLYVCVSWRAQGQGCHRTQRLLLLGGASVPAQERQTPSSSLCHTGQRELVASPRNTACALRGDLPAAKVMLPRPRPTPRAKASPLSVTLIERSSYSTSTERSVSAHSTLATRTHTPAVLALVLPASSSLGNPSMRRAGSRDYCDVR